MPEKLEKKRSLPTALEKRFGARMEIGGNIVDTIDIIPDRPTHKTTILVAPGFNASIHTNTPLLEMLSEGGRRVVSLNQPHAPREIHAESSDKSERVADFPKTEIRKAMNLLELIEAKGVDTVDCFAFSEGALNTLLAAYMRPEKFNTIVLSAPAGLIGDDSLFKLAMRFRSQGSTDNSLGMPSVDSFRSAFPELASQEQTMRDHVAETWKEDEEAAHAHPFRTIEDLWALSHMRIDDLVSFARAAGIKIAILTGVDDQVFPAETMARRLPKDSVDGFVSTIGAHGPHYSARIANYLFERLDEKRRKEAGQNA